MGDEGEIRRGKGETLLIIDDESAFVEITKILMNMAGYEVITASNGQEGTEKFTANKGRVNLIICDLNMPKLGGHSLIQSLLAIQSNIKILIVSGSIEEEHIQQYLLDGVIEFLQKPFLNDTLLAKLRKLLD